MIEYWPIEFDLQSKKEGWILTNGSPIDNMEERYYIAKLDDPSSVDELDYDEPKFRFDEDAQQYVVSRAGEGSKLHLYVLFLYGQKYGEESPIPSGLRPYTIST